MAETVRIRGLKELQQALQAFPGKLQRRSLRRGLREASKPVVASAKSLAPSRTGVLRRNIVQRAGRARGRDSIRHIVGVEHGKVQRLTAATGRTVVRGRKGLRLRKATARERRGDDPFYWRFQELGFKAVGRRRGGPGRKIPGKRFLTRAFQVNEQRMIERFRIVVAAEVQKLQKGGR